MDHLSDKFQFLVKKNPKLLNYLQQSAMDGIWYWQLTKPEDKWVTPKFWEVLGYSANQVQIPIWKVVHPNDLELWSNFIRNCTSQKTTINQQTLRFIHKKSRIIWMQCKGSLFREEAADYMLITFRDITAFKEKEKLFLDTNRNAKIGAWDLNLETNELYWSDMTKVIHEVPADFQPKLEEGINFYKEGYSRDTISHCLEEALTKGNSWNVELQIITHKDREVWIRAIGNVEFYNGKALRIYGSFQDIDEEKKMVDQLTQLSVLEAQNKEIEQFAYIVSHDLREPLTSMKGYMRLLQEDFSTELSLDAQELLDAIIEAADRMDVLIHDLLGYSQEGKEQEKQWVDVAKIIEQVLYDLSVQIKKNQATFKIGKLPSLLAYSTELKSVFQNLISNALKFARPDIPLVIEITAHLLKDEWKFMVLDNGIGIPKRSRQKIFNIFQRLHREEYSGTGIGLASCKKIVEHHDGRIWVESKLGQGSCFCFIIPTS